MLHSAVTPTDLVREDVEARPENDPTERDGPCSALTDGACNEHSVTRGSQHIHYSHVEFFF
jgi:hypothetical protein